MKAVEYGVGIASKTMQADLDDAVAHRRLWSTEIILW